MGFSALRACAVLPSYLMRASSQRYAANTSRRLVARELHRAKTTPAAKNNAPTDCTEPTEVIFLTTELTEYTDH